MRTIALCLAGMLLTGQALADAMLPHDVVKAAIEYAQQDNLELFKNFVDVVSIERQKEQPRSPKAIVQLLKSIELKAATIDDPRGGHKQGARVQVSMAAPLKIRFIVVCTGVQAGEPRWKITEIYVEPGSNPALNRTAASGPVSNSGGWVRRCRLLWCSAS